MSRRNQRQVFQFHTEEIPAPHALDALVAEKLWPKKPSDGRSGMNAQHHEMLVVGAGLGACPQRHTFPKPGVRTGA
jgi:hypothetical protein